jgi:hypothetical protein
MVKSKRSQKNTDDIRHYFVDEGGDSILFSSKGRVIIETLGCSRFFMLGLLDVPNSRGLQHDFNELRTKLMNDPYFKNVPSLQANEQKTALVFHAKDDLPEVRKEVFTLLRNTEGLRYFAVVADKWRVLEYVRQQNERNPSYHYHPNELYDYLARRLFKGLLHKDGGYEIVFSKRGASDRTAALRQALETARERFAKQWNIASSASMNVSAATPLYHPGLQAVDYFTWALQRLYEKGEERYLTFLWPSVHLVQDIDDKRKAGYGAYYTQKKPLNAAALAWRQEKEKPGI